MFITVWMIFIYFYNLRCFSYMFNETAPSRVAIVFNWTKKPDDLQEPGQLDNSFHCKIKNLKTKLLTWTVMLEHWIFNKNKFRI